MAAQTRSDIVVTGAASLVVGPKAPIQPARWVGTPAKLARMDRLCGLALVAADGALADAGLSPQDPSWNGDRTAVVLGTAYGCHATNEDYYRGLLAQGASGASPRLFAYTLPSSPVGEISIHYGIRGPAVAIAPGMTAGIDVLSAALREIRSGRADPVIAVAADVGTPTLQRLAAIPTLADSSAALLLERTADSAVRGSSPRARILATASAFSAGRRLTASLDAARSALSQADVEPGAIRRLLCSPLDHPAARELGIEAPATDEVPEALGAAPLVALTRWFPTARGLLLLLTSDPEGSASAAILDPGN